MKAVAPLVPAELDIRGLEWMPLYGDRLFSSETWLCAGPEGRCAALQLWWASWKQVPAASLADDDRVLAALAGYGMAVNAWLTVKADALRGWVKCSDGRLYHPIVAELAIEAGKLRDKAKVKHQQHVERVRKWRRGNKTTDVPPPGSSSGGTVRGGDASPEHHVTRTDASRDALDITGQDITGRESPPSADSQAGARAGEGGDAPPDPPPDEPPPPPEPAARPWAEPLRFAEWFDAYPRQDGREEAMRAYRKARARSSDSELILALRATEFDASQNGKFIPSAARWLNEDRWRNAKGLHRPANGLGPKLVELPERAHRTAEQDRADGLAAVMEMVARRRQAPPSTPFGGSSASPFGPHDGPMLEGAVN